MIITDSIEIRRLAQDDAVLIGIFGWRPSKRAQKHSVALLRAKMHSL